MSDEGVLCKETTYDVETTKVEEVFVLENEDELQKFSQGELNNLVRNSWHCQRIKLLGKEE